MTASASQSSKTFTCGDVATVATGTIFIAVPRLYEVLNFLTGDNLYTHQLPRAGRWCAERIALQESVRPAFICRMKFDEPYITRENYLKYLERWKTKWGDSFEVFPMEGWHRVDALKELETMVPSEKIIAVKR